MSDKFFNVGMTVIMTLLVFILGVAVGHQDILADNTCSAAVTASKPVNL